MSEATYLACYWLFEKSPTIQNWHHRKRAPTQVPDPVAMSRPCCGKTWQSNWLSSIIIAQSRISDNLLSSYLFLSLDIEIGGEYVGIVQLSAEIVPMKLVAGRGVAQDRVEEVVRLTTFDNYVKLKCNIRGTGMYPHTSDISWGWAYHQCSQHQPSLVLIQDLAEWSCWHEWNHHPCCLEWGKRQPQVPVEDYAGTKVMSILPTSDSAFYWSAPCHHQLQVGPLHKSKSKIEGYDLGSKWKYINGHNLNGAHNSHIDVKAQIGKTSNKMFVSFITINTSIQILDAIFSATEQNEWRKELETERPVHSPWVEQTKANNFEWTSQEVDSYTGFAGGPLVGPTKYVKALLYRHKTLQVFSLQYYCLRFSPR